MINKKIAIADTIIRTSTSYPTTVSFCNDYDCDNDNQTDFSVTLTPEDIDFERLKAAREDEIEGNPTREYSDAYLETLALLRKITEALFDYDTLLFHGSVVAVDGKAYLFTAKSGTGKSTHTRLWREYLGDRATMVNDDKPFLKITENGVLACGSPWMGKHGLGSNIQVPLKAICILERGEENHIRRIHPKDAVYMLLQQSSRPMDAKKLPKYLDLVDALSKKVEFYRLQCNMDPEAAKIAFEVMSGKATDWEI